MCTPICDVAVTEDGSCRERTVRDADLQAGKQAGRQAGRDHTFRETVLQVGYE